MIDFSSYFANGDKMYKWASDLFPINRSITGKGVRETFFYIKSIIPDLNIKSFKSGEKVFDWSIPDEWEVIDAYVISPEGKKILDFKKNNLHLVGYSIPINKKIDLDELNRHLFSIEENPDAIPYVTSYYSKTWGFCISHNERLKLKKGSYHVVINSKHFEGKLNYGEILIKGKTKDEILISTYICHPSMANNELSGPVVTMNLILWLQSQKNLTYSYRIIFIPETIGSIAYISKNLKKLKQNVKGGFVITCVGDNNNYSILNSKYDNSMMQKIGDHVLKYHTNNSYNKFSFLKRGSDERQFSSPGVDIDCISLMRTKYGEYEEYHTSKDNLDFISPEGLFGGFNIHKKAIEILENNLVYKIKVLCEPQLGKRGLYPKISTKSTQSIVKNMMNLITYLDGKNDLLTIADKIDVHFNECLKIIKNLKDENLIEVNNQV